MVKILHSVGLVVFFPKPAQMVKNPKNAGDARHLLYMLQQLSAVTTFLLLLLG